MSVEVKNAVTGMRLYLRAVSVFLSVGANVNMHREAPVKKKEEYQSYEAL